MFNIRHGARLARNGVSYVRIFPKMRSQVSDVLWIMAWAMKMPRRMKQAASHSKRWTASRMEKLWTLMSLMERLLGSNKQKRWTSRPTADARVRVCLRPKILLIDLSEYMKSTAEKYGREKKILTRTAIRANQWLLRKNNNELFFCWDEVRICINTRKCIW